MDTDMTPKVERGMRVLRRAVLVAFLTGLLMLWNIRWATRSLDDVQTGLFWTISVLLSVFGLLGGAAVVAHYIAEHTP